MPNEMTTEEMLNDLDKHYQGQLTEWQEVFVCSQLNNMQACEESGFTHTFTERQANKIAEIYAEKDEEV